MSREELERDYVKALGHPVRLRLLETIVEQGEMSPVGLARQLGQPLSSVSRHMRMLRDLGFIELVRTEPRRGTVERFYRAKSLAFIDDEDWERLPVTLRRGLARQTFRKLFLDAAEAGAYGGFDDGDAHLDLVPLALDRIGRAEVSQALHACLRTLQEIQVHSDQRRRATPDGHDAVATAVAMMHYWRRVE